jgi:hypothetical protein
MSPLSSNRVGDPMGDLYELIGSPSNPRAVCRRAEEEQIVVGCREKFPNAFSSNIDVEEGAAYQIIIASFASENERDAAMDKVESALAKTSEIAEFYTAHKENMLAVVSTTDRSLAETHVAAGKLARFIKLFEGSKVEPKQGFGRSKTKDNP